MNRESSWRNGRGMMFVRAVEYYAQGGFVPSLHGIDRIDPSKLVLQNREALRLQIRPRG